MFSDKTPYIVTLVVAAFAWLVSYTVERYERVAVIEHSVKVSTVAADASAASATRFTATFKNVSLALAVECARFNLAALASDGKSVPLQFDGVTYLTSTLVKHSLAQEGKLLELRLESMQPAAALSVDMYSDSVANLRVLVAPCDTHKDQSPGPLPILKEPSLETYMLTHTLSVLWAGFAVWLMLLGSYAIARMMPRFAAINTAVAPPASPAPPKGGNP